MTPRSSLSFPSQSPEIHRERDPTEKRKSEYPHRSKKELYKNTPPPAEGDSDFVMVQNGRWPTQQRYRNRHHDKNQFRLKSQQFQFNRLREFEGLKCLRKGR